MNANLYNLLLAIHIIAVALWLGANFSMGVAANRSVGASNEINAWWAGVQGLMGRTMKNAAFALLLLTGIGMVLGSDESIKFSAPFVSIGFLVVIVGGALGGMVFAPGARKAAESFQSGDAATALPAYRHFLVQYPRDPEAAHVHLMLALIRTRYVPEAGEARREIEIALATLTDPDDAALANQLLHELGPAPRPPLA